MNKRKKEQPLKTAIRDIRGNDKMPWWAGIVTFIAGVVSGMFIMALVILEGGDNDE